MSDPTLKDQVMEALLELQAEAKQQPHPNEGELEALGLKPPEQEQDDV